MVLLYGVPGDGPFELIADALEYAEIPFVTLNQRKFEVVDFSFQHTNKEVSGILTIEDNSYDLQEFTGIYNRAVDFSMLPEAKAFSPDSARFTQYALSFQLLNQWIEINNCRVLNKASAMSSNSSKPYQLLLIAPFFKVPPTLVTNNITELIAFREKYGPLIYKSASSVRSVVHTLDEINHADLQNIRYCPTLFQKKLSGTNYRVHIVGDEIFATRISSESVDYRYSHLEGNNTTLVPVELTTTIAERCLLLSKSLQLPLCGIDLFETEEGTWYCFEVNPSPGFSYFENETGQPIAASIAHYLSKK